MSLRTRVLSAFRTLHKTRIKIFNGDEVALNAGRMKINDQFKQHKNETDVAQIEQLVQLAEDSEKVLRTTVVQARERDDGIFEMHVTPDTKFGVNTIFDPEAEIPTPRKKKS
ncbi:complex III assembly factor LYRM7-like isoform X2 [Gigantopelta aegis]|uniref:complex III assembly factor LYRM7-like isoform X2 n=1 Tax=Gigantopelta aegis TaxID=1735272 RepID=UPI001B88D1BD|nr:complex III assembly factor LYRM7-like isoform X2 [Gigantopelta aegis]